MAAVQRQEKRQQRAAAGNGANGRRAQAARRDGGRLRSPEDAHPRLRVRRFDADQRDREITLKEALASSPTSRQLLWVDVEGQIEPDVLEALGKRFKFDVGTRRALEFPDEQPHLSVHGSYFSLSVAAEPSHTRVGPPIWLHMVASRNVVISRRTGTIEFVDEIDRRIKSDATIGSIEGAEFVGMLLEAVVTSYFAAVDAVEDAIDDIDALSLRDDGRRDVLDDLVKLRRGITALRQILSAHRSVFAALSGPDIRQLLHGKDAVGDLQSVTNRFDAALGAVESSREALLGSFDVYMTRTAQRTNEVMKVLTIATVLLLPGSVIAGLLGMNVIVPLNKDDPMSFWFVLGGVVLLAAVVIGVARLRRWI